WMAHFRYGPMEYVWRLLTYGYRSLRSSPTRDAVSGAGETLPHPALAEASVEPHLQPLELPAAEAAETQPTLSACEPPGSQTSTSPAVCSAPSVPGLAVLEW